MGEQDRRRVTQNVSLDARDQRALRWLADLQAGGNVSLVIRRLIRAEAARYEYPDRLGAKQEAA